MKIQFLNGGLANQVFQYIFVRYAELAHPEHGTWFIDDSFFFVNDIHNGYELKKVFNIDANLLSQTFDDDVWDEFIKNKRNGISIPQTFKDMGTDIIMYAETENYDTFNPFDGQKIRMFPANEFHPEIVSIQYPNIYYHGYWINKNWLASYKDIILKELSFPEIPLASAREYANQIMSSSSVAIHIRRGDYVSLGWELPQDYYNNSLHSFAQSGNRFTLFVFSDDLEWCRANASELGFSYADKVIYVSGNTKEYSYLDMQLMSLCEGIVMSNSAFCYLAALMDKRLKLYTNPTQREV